MASFGCRHIDTVALLLEWLWHHSAPSQGLLAYYPRLLSRSTLAVALSGWGIASVISTSIDTASPRATALKLKKFDK